MSDYEVLTASQTDALRKDEFDWLIPEESPRIMYLIIGGEQVCTFVSPKHYPPFNEMSDEDICDYIKAPFI